MSTQVEKDMADHRIFEIGNVQRAEPTFDATCRLQIEKYRTQIARLQTDERTKVFELGQLERDIQTIRDQLAESERGLVAARAALSRFYDAE